jgi:hypothetical protein
VAPGSGRDPLQDVPRRGLGAGLRARLPVAEHLRGPRAALHAAADAPAEAPGRVDGGVGGVPARVRSEGIRGTRGRPDGQHGRVRGCCCGDSTERRREAHRACRPVAHGALQPHQPHDALPCLWR